VTSSFSQQAAAPWWDATFATNSQAISSSGNSHMHSPFTSQTWRTPQRNQHPCTGWVTRIWLQACRDT